MTTPATPRQRKVIAVIGLAYLGLVLAAGVVLGMVRHSFMAGLAVVFAGGLLALIGGVAVSVFALKARRFWADQGPRPDGG